jgi:hypothetical protein
MADDLPLFQFLVPPALAAGGAVVFDRKYPYHVMVAGKVVLKSRDVAKARCVAACVAGQFWRTPVVPQYPAFCVCDFEREAWYRGGAA